MTPPTQTAEASPEKRRHVEEGIANIRQALLALRFGSIAVTVHDDRIVQIDVTEKTRLKSAP
ncbi:YezD family protein [Pelagerythrobacter sp.]|uniref:YezD family protein n=1 Tax=Pelagerythrobacter sp. TaxID=2800702 RepID=UPI0035AD90CF